MLPRRLSGIILNRVGQLSTLPRPTTSVETTPLAQATKGNEDSRGHSFWPSLSTLFLAAPIAAAVAWWPLNSPAWADFESHKSVNDEHKTDAEDHSLLSLRTRQRLFFAYEKRIRFVTWSIRSERTLWFRWNVHQCKSRLMSKGFPHDIALQRVASYSKWVPVSLNPSIWTIMPPLRDNSSLDKVFDYFSSLHAEDGSKQMLPHDLLRAIVPTYPPSKSKIDRAGSLEGELCW